MCRPSVDTINIIVSGRISNEWPRDKDSTATLPAYIKCGYVELSDGSRVSLDESYFTGVAPEVLQAISFELEAEADRYFSEKDL